MRYNKVCEKERIMQVFEETMVKAMLISERKKNEYRGAMFWVGYAKGLTNLITALDLRGRKN